jgi:hypothetical protein
MKAVTQPCKTLRPNFRCPILAQHVTAIARARYTFTAWQITNKRIT